MKEWMDGLSEELKAKLHGMGENISAEQLIQFCKEENLDLPDDLLDGVGGGVDSKVLVTANGPGNNITRNSRNNTGGFTNK